MNDNAFVGIGWKFPVECEEASGKIKTNAYEDDIVESIRLILNTRKGERIMRPDFGSMLNTYVFDSFTLSSLTMMEEEVKNSLTLWEPRIRDIEVKAIQSKEKPGCAEITISYVIRTTNNPENMLFSFYIKEGS